MGRAPDLVRARLLARARATVAASHFSPAPIPMSATPSRWRGLRVALAAAVLLSLGAAGAMAALRARAARAPEILPSSIRSSMAKVRPPAPEFSAVAPIPTPALQPVSRANSQRPGRSVSARESYTAELETLQRAQSRYASRDYSDALMLIAEHARRFPNGRLAEEREALRVRSLAGAGRADETRRAFTAFAKRFPHSALLPRLQEAAPVTEE
jgi:hypothetical protein